MAGKLVRDKIDAITVVNIYLHTANSTDGRLNVLCDSAPNFVVSEDTIEISSFDYLEVDFVSKSYPFVVAQLDSPNSLSDAYRETHARLNSHYFEACYSYPIVAFHHCWG